MNFLLIQSIATSARYYGDSFTVECPTGSGRFLPLREVADELAARLTRAVLATTSIFRTTNTGVTTTSHSTSSFTGDNGAGLGAGHQTGWTALVALLLQFGGQLCFERLGTSDGDRASAVQEGLRADDVDRATAAQEGVRVDDTDHAQAVRDRVREIEEGQVA
jgi:hypothetical protein